MSDEIEAAGAAVMAGLAAGAIEKSDSHGAYGRHCANCGSTLKGRFCHQCGQSGHVHRSLGAVFEELVHGILHFDGRAFRTLPMLAFRPGTLTGDYIFGMRARYISPIALFLFVVFLMFFVFSLMGGVGPSPAASTSANVTTTQLRANIVQAQKDVSEAEADLLREREALAKLQAEPNALRAGEIEGQRGVVMGAEGSLTGAKAELGAAQSAWKAREDRIAEFQKARDQLAINDKAARAKAPSEDQVDEVNKVERAIRRVDQALANPKGPPAGWRVETRDDGEVNVSISVSDAAGVETVMEEIKQANAAGRVNVNTGVAEWDKKIREKLNNPELAWYKIQNAAYKFAFLLVPISLPFVALLFLFNGKVTLYDHAVFVLYSLSFVCILAMASSLLATYAPALVPNFLGALAVVLPIHMFFQLKGGYGLSWWSALWRAALLVVFAAICLALFIGAIFVLGLIG